MAKGDELEDRLVKFAEQVLDLCDTLPKSYAGQHIADQLTRSATSPAPNYGEARGAESRKDFIHKLGVVLKELNESRLWLRILRDRKMASISADRLYQECDELCRIFAASRKSAQKNADAK